MFKNSRIFLFQRFANVVYVLQRLMIFYATVIPSLHSRVFFLKNILKASLFFKFPGPLSSSRMRSPGLLFWVPLRNAAKSEGAAASPSPSPLAKKREEKTLGEL